MILKNKTPYANIKKVLHEKITRDLGSNLEKDNFRKIIIKKNNEII